MQNAKGSDGLEFWADPTGQGEPKGRHNLMKGAFIFADKILFVSKGHRDEGLTVERGYGLDGVLKSFKDKLTYVYNAISTKNHKASNLDALKKDEFNSKIGKNEIAWKRTNKKALQEKLGLEVNPDNIVLGIVTRMVKNRRASTYS